jgi:hypothetical protein
MDIGDVFFSSTFKERYELGAISCGNQKQPTCEWIKRSCVSHFLYLKGFSELTDDIEACHAKRFVYEKKHILLYSPSSG